MKEFGLYLTIEDEQYLNGLLGVKLPLALICRWGEGFLYIFSARSGLIRRVMDNCLVTEVNILTTRLQNQGTEYHELVVEDRLVSVRLFLYFLDYALRDPLNSEWREEICPAIQELLNKEGF